MTKMCKEILNHLRHSADHTFLYWDLDNSPFEDQNEFFDAVRYLESQGLVEYVATSGGQHIGIHASHVAMHPVKLGTHPFLHWLFHDYLGGVVIGATSTLVSEFWLALLTVLFLKLLGVSIL